MANKRRNNIYKPKEYTYRSIREDREYGFFWYEWLWKILRPVTVFFCSLLIILGVVNFGYHKVYNALFAPMGGGELVTFEIESGESVTKIGNDLVEKGIIRNASVFKYIVQFKGLTNAISYGEYELSGGMTVSEVVDVLCSGAQTNERTITIIPGWDCEDIAEYLVDQGAIDSAESFLTLCNQPEIFIKNSYALSAAYESGRLEGRKYALEGYLAPDTYRVFMSADSESIIRTLLTQGNKVIDEVIYEDHSEFSVDDEGVYTEVEKYHTDLTMDEIIILASMIEREAGSVDEYAKVSAVFYNRLNSGMKLQSDAGINYITRRNAFVLTQEEVAMDSPYNTYVYDGLPVGAICMPSKNAMMAAMYPDLEYINEGYLYFCCKEPTSRELVFAVTLEEHQANVERYQPLWQAYDELH